MIPFCLVGHNLCMEPLLADALLDDVVGKYSQFLNPGLARLMAFAGYGVEMKAEGCYLYDHSGRKFLDCLGGYGVFSLGHRHPKVVEAVKKQLDQIPLSSKVFFGKAQADLAALLNEIVPDPLQYTFFVNSGTEASEAALKFAKAATGKSKIVSTIDSYHGKTIGALSTTGREKYRLPFDPLMPGVSFVPFNDLHALENAIDKDTAAVILETIQGEGGIHVGTTDYLRGVRDVCTRNQVLLIVDEVQTGFGRTGKMFGMDHPEIVPDIVTFAKALGGGVMPIGAVMATESVWNEVFGKNPLIHTSTFGGNPLACAAGIAAIQTTVDENIVQRSEKMGSLMKQGLQQVAQQNKDLIKEVRGLGLMLGVEFSMDDVGELCIGQMVKRNVVAAYTLNNPRVIRFEPPLIISESEVEQAVNVFGEAVYETSQLLSAVLD